MLKQRVMTAVVLMLAVLAALLWLPSLWFDALVFVVLATGGWEWTLLSGLFNTSARVAYVACLVSAGLLLSWLGHDAMLAALLLASLWWWLALLLVICYPASKPWLSQRGSLLASGFLVLVPGMLALPCLQWLAGDQRFYVLWFIALVAAADIGAYFSGKAFGKTRLAPTVSPNKTWEGFIGGVLSTCVVAIAGAHLPQAAALDQVTTLALIAGAVLLALFSVAGDLFESLLKRQQNLKDSGSWLPGHGGVMDRLDSITAALPLFVLMLTWAVTP